nr:GMC family oxidoreductase N-terminal domain-containing protein [uncultured Brevundimonas sp.]
MVDLEAQTFDYIIVGAGSSGAVLATRLSEDPGVNVLLVEAGPEDDSYWSKLPLGFGKILFQERYVSRHMSEPEAELQNRQIALPYGHLLGGSSAINGLVFLRGAPWDYDDWAAKGATGWSYADVLPYFRKLEKHYKGNSPYHGADGPFGVERARWKSGVADAILDSAQSLGVPRNDDMNGETLEGCFYNELATWNGRRSSTSQAYLKPNRGRRNLTIMTETTARKVVFEGRRAVGVEVQNAAGRRTLKARREVILSAGALHTPKLLQLSGIGDGALLREYGLPIVHDLKGVGANLMDHLNVVCPFTTTHRDTFNKRVNSPLGMIREGLNYYLGSRNTPLAIGAGLAGMYLRSRREAPHPDLQVGFAPFMPGPKGYDLAKQSGFFIGGYKAQPTSRGWVKISSSDPTAAPRVAFNHLSTPDDEEAVVAALRFIGKMSRTDALRRINAVTQAPVSADASDDDLLAYARSVASTSFHYSGTARMGQDDLSVVDENLRVRGVDGLRVVDASVMPVVVSCNTNPASIMIGERAADLIRGKVLPPAEVRPTNQVREKAYA